MQITRASVVVYRNLEDFVESLESANMLVYVSKRIRLQFSLVQNTREPSAKTIS